MSNRKSRKERADTVKNQIQPRRICNNCGKKGSHYVPPSFGDSGFYSCNALSKHYN